MPNKLKDFCHRFFSKNSLTQYNNFFWLFCITALICRFFWLIEVSVREDFSSTIIYAILSGTLYDVVFICKTCAALFIPYLIFNYLCPVKTKISGIVIISIYVLVSNLLNEYFLTEKILLDHIICLYDFESLMGIVLSSSKVSLSQIMWISGSIVIPLLCTYFLTKIKYEKKIASYITLLAIFLTTICVNYQNLLFSNTRYKSEQEYDYAVNKLAYIIYDITQVKTNKSINSDIESAIVLYQKIYDKQFTNRNYPLIHEENTHDVLGNFFSISESKKLPNFVFIVVESMGQQYTGFPKTSVPLMPFIDSLKSISLYWPNCLSTAERTFAVLSSVFASAPHGEHGFANDWTIIPNHNSIIKDFNQNGYTTSYFYGGDNTFDGQQDFLSRNNFSYIMDARKDTTTSFYIEKTKRWGMDDADVFKKAIEHKKKNISQPYVDVYQTLSTHEPCIVPDSSYLQRVTLMSDTLHFACEQEKNNYLNHLNMYACFLYTDDCIRTLFDEYKKRDDFNNTIFVLFGDHRMGENVPNLNNPLQKYHVPLIIYSPLLKQPRQMESVVSHWDITPSINAFLNKNYDYKIDSLSHWMGKELDTNKNFNINQTLTFMLNNRSVEDLLLDSLFLSRGRLYSINNDLTCNHIENEKQGNMMKDILLVLNNISQYVCKNDLVCPSNYEKKEKILDIQEKENKICVSEYQNICQFRLSRNAEILHLNFACNYKNTSPNLKNTDIVIAIEKDGQKLYYRKWNIGNFDDYPSSVSQHTTHKLYTDADYSNAIVTIYFWNQNLCKFEYSDMSLQIYAE